MIRKQGKLVKGGDGKTQDISRAGILFESAKTLEADMVLRLIVDWPVRFQGKTRVKWIVDAVVVRSSALGTAVNIMRQRFERPVKRKEERLAG